MNQFWLDLRYTLRTLRKAKALTVIAVLTLAIAIGANTAIFSVVNAAMIRPLPYPNANRLMGIYHTYRQLNMQYVTVYPDAYAYYRDHATSFDQMAAYTYFTAPQNLTGSGDPSFVRAAKATAQFFSVLGTKPLIGRTFTPQEDAEGAGRVAVLSYGMWTRRFGGAQMLGREITLDGANYTVIGVMPKGFEFPEKSELWVPMAFTSKEAHEGSEYLMVIATRRPGVTSEQAEAEMTKLTREILVRDNNTKNSEGWSADTEPLQKASVSDVRTALWILLGAVGCVVLIACANIANLLLARATARQKEIAIRTALGASRWRVVRQFVTEGLVLGVLGGVAGLLLAYVGLDLLLTLVPVKIPSFIRVEIDTTVLAFTFGVSILAGLIFSSLPALQATRANLNENLKEGGQSSSAAGRSVVRGMIAVGQIALAMMLLVSAGLLIKTFVRVQQGDLGFNPDNVLTFRTLLPDSKYKEPPKALAFYDQLQERLRTLPGVRSVAITSAVPLTENMKSSFDIQGKTFDVQPHAHVTLIGPEYFQTLQIPVLSGRAFTSADREGGEQVAIIDQAAARMYFGAEDPLGKKLTFRFGDKPVPRTIVGVVGSVKHTNPLQNETKGQVFLPYAQLTLFPGMIVAVRTEGDPTRIAEDARRAVLAVDPAQPVEEVQTMQEVLDDFVAQPRFNMVLLGIFAAIALTLAAIGVYGVMAYWVVQRTREIGVRVALGASRQVVIQLILGQAWRIAALGIVGGLIGTVIATRSMASLLFGVRASDPSTYVAVAVLLAGIALLASYVPARRATKIDPMVALRYD